MVDKNKINVLIISAKGNPKVVTEDSSKEILKEYGISVPPFALVTSPEEDYC